MTDTTLLFALAFAGGLAVGWVYFYGLYRTVRALPRAGRPALLLGASLLLRAGILIGGAWLLLRAGAGAGHLLAALAGVLAMRVLLVGRFGNLRGGAPSPTRAAARDNDPGDRPA